MHIVNSPSIPFWGHITGGVLPGTVIQIDGHIPQHCSKFEISLYCGNELGHHAEKHSNIALQIRPKIHSKKVICNSRLHHSWGHKEKHRNFHHVHHGSNFMIQIIVEHQHYRIVINGQEIAYFHHRIPFHEVRVLNIEGHVNVHRIEYRNQYSGQPSAPVYPSAPPAYVPPVSYPPVSQPMYPPSAAVYPPSATVYPPSATVYPPSATVYPPSATVYPAPPVYVAPPYAQPAYVPASTVVYEDHHHHGHHHHGGIIDAIFGHHDSHHHHGHHHRHHHGHH